MLVKWKCDMKRESGGRWWSLRCTCSTRGV